MKNSKSSFKSSAACTSSDTSFSEYFQNVSYNIISDESTQIISTFRSTENLSLKSVIFFLAIRKAYKNSASRYSKFAFYLIRSLYKESISRSSKVSLKPKITREKKRMLRKLQNYLKSTKENELKRIYFNICKEFPKVRLVRVKRIETITKVFMIFYKNVVKKLKKSFLMLKKPSKIEIFVQKLEKFLIKSLFYPKKLQISIKVFQFLHKPKHNLPYIKFASKSPMKEPNIKVLTCLKSNKKPQNLPRKPETSRLHQRGIIRLCVLNRNYFVIKKKVFYKLTEIVDLCKRLEFKNRAEGFRSIFEGLLRKKYLDVVYRLASARRDFEYFKFLTQIMGFVKSKCENNLKLEAFEAIYLYQRPKVLDCFEIKIIYEMMRILNTKVFNKRFLAFILIKGFAKLNKGKRENRIVRDCESYKDGRLKVDSDSMRLRIKQCARPTNDKGNCEYEERVNRVKIGKAVGILDRISFEYRGRLIDQSFTQVKEIASKERYFENCWDFMDILKKIIIRYKFLQQLESFESIKYFSSNLFKHNKYRALKLRSLLRRRYTKISALCFL